MRIVVLDGYTTNPGDLSWAWLGKYGEYTVYDFTPRGEVVERARECEIVIDNKTVLDADVLSRLPKLKYIGLLSTGYNIADINFADSIGVPVTNIPSYSTEAVAQMTAALLLELSSKVGMHDAAVKRGEWCATSNFCFWREPLVELCGKTLGIIGFGRIGGTVAGIARAMGMSVVACTPHPRETDGVEFVTLDELLSRSDAVTLHTPLNSLTEGMVDEAFLSKMKRTAFLINTSRGTVINERALADALKSGKIAGAAVDVLSCEPPAPNNPLLSCENCIITPHISWAAFETRERLMSVCEGNLAGFLSGKPQNVVNLKKP